MEKYNNFREYALGNWEMDGMSAKCLYGVRHHISVPCAYPHDPDDLCRCIQVLRLMFGDDDNACITHVEKVSNFHDSVVWRRYAKRWSELISLFMTEWKSPSAPKTYALMKEIIDGKRED